MNKPEDMFDIGEEWKEFEGGTGKGLLAFSYRQKRYFLIYKHTGERHKAKTRGHDGYSQLSDCKRARTRLFNDYIKTMEQELLGKSDSK